ncbi:hypothetical protein JTB14_013082 [Gonioctena quinquepunctata]|nr:hypothetical protein JTB14_013082 [Gonioctena quinquepunctata]
MPFDELRMQQLDTGRPYVDLPGILQIKRRTSSPPLAQPLRQLWRMQRLLFRSLLCTATNEIPHERIFEQNRRSANGCSLPSWLVPSTTVLIKEQVRSSKYDPMVGAVELIDDHNTPESG